MENILQEIMKEGVLVEPKAAGKISLMQESERAELLERVRAEKPLVIGEEFFQNIIEVAEFQEAKKISVQESASRLNSYFNAMQKLFGKAGRAVSVSNASENSAVIGTVMNVLPDGFELEDQTGAIKVASKTQVEEDDVAMVFGKAANKTLYADLVEFPDMPEKQVKKSPKRCEVVFGKNSGDADYSITFGEKISIGKDSLVVGKNPAQVKINNILILIHNTTVNGAASALQILKKRRLQGTRFAIAEAPDIFLTTANGNVLENYRGTTVVAVSDKSFARINLKTREVKIEELPEQKQAAMM